jgi:hypothetical protein
MSPGKSSMLGGVHISAALVVFMFDSVEATDAFVLDIVLSSSSVSSDVVSILETVVVEVIFEAFVVNADVFGLPFPD